MGCVAITFSCSSLGLYAAIFNVADSRAVGDEHTLTTVAIQKTIDAAAAAGGGTATFPKGVFLTGALFLKSNVELHLVESVVVDSKDKKPFAGINCQAVELVVAGKTAILVTLSQSP